MSARQGDAHSTDATAVSVNGAAVATPNRGQVHEQLIAGNARITADKPILVAQYSNGSSFDGVTSDPFEMLVPPLEQFLPSYTVTTPASGFAANFVNLTVPNAAIGAVTLDGVVVPAASFSSIPGTTFSGAQVSVAVGAHALAGPLPFGVSVYGFADFDSYGYPGGLSLSPIAQVTSVSLAPKTATNPVNTEHCVTATVLDQNNAPLTGIRVDFAVTGVNPTVGFAFTDATGKAAFCYTGANVGGDTITASVGTLSDTASKTWTASNPGADVAVAKSCTPTTVLPGGQVTCTLTVTNAGPADAADVVVTDSLSSGTTLVGTPGGGGFACVTSGTSPQVSCTLASLASGSTAAVTVVMRVGENVGPDTALTDTATVSSATPDPTPANDTASFTVATPACTINAPSPRNADPIFGTPGNDVICGTAFGDIINGRGGDDIIFGLGGDDIIKGGDGNDTIFGGEGNDIIEGGSGNDSMFGGSGDDTFYGGTGNDSASGGPGKDTLDGEGGNDTLTGGADADTATGGAGVDVCSAELRQSCES